MDWIRGYFKELKKLKKRNTGKSQLEDVGVLMDDNLYERDILIAAKILASSPYLKDRIQASHVGIFSFLIKAIKDLGHLSWSGGPPVARFAANYLVNMMSIISDSSMPLCMRLSTVQAIGNICSTKENRERASMIGLAEVLCQLLNDENPEHEELRHNAVSSLLILMCENRDNQRVVLTFPNVQDTVRRISKEDWTSWPTNEALRMCAFLGFDRQ